MKTFLFAIMSVVASPVIADPSRSNVLFIIVDDLATTLGCYGDPDASTPSMDQLAGRGVKFDHCYTQFSVCNPSRCSFLTGCYPEKTRAMDLSTSLRVGLPTEATLLQHFSDHGYRVGRIGKVFHVPDPLTNVEVEVGAPLGRDNALLLEAKAKQATNRDGPAELTGRTRRGIVYNRDYAASDHPETDYTDYKIASDAIKTLHDFKDDPFFLTVGFIRPHTPFVAPQSFFDLIDPSTITMPAFYQAAGENRRSIPVAALRPNNNVFRLAPPTAREAVEGKQAYLASTAWVDSQVGRVLQSLRDLHLEDSNIVMLTGDHGYHLGEHGLWAKQTLFEEGTRVPLIIAGPGIAPGVASGLVEQVDLYPTLTDLASLPTPDHVQGRTLGAMLKDPANPGKRAAHSTMISTHTKLVGHSIRTDRFRYIQWGGGGGGGGHQLYDHLTDPRELVNLADQPQQAARVERLKKRIAEHLVRVGGDAAVID